MPFQPADGSTLGPYRLTRLLGRGGMGEVYLAQDTRLDRKVALKLLSAQFAKDAERILRFTQEARAASALNHPNIITIYDIGESGDVPYIATEFIDGQTLRQQMDAGPLTLAQSLDYAIQAGSALAAAHQAGIVHRDIKPENIMVRADGYVKVVDFGLAKLAERPANPEDSGTVLMSPALTTFGTVMGTVQYMSPEQARGQMVDGRSDIFSLGIVLYEMIAGHTPFTGETTSHQIVAILEKEAPPLTGIAGIPAELENAVGKALAKDAGQRYQTCAELVADLKEIRRWLDLEASLQDSNVTGRLTRSGALSRVSGAVPAAPVPAAPVIAAPEPPAAPATRPARRRMWLVLPIAAALALAGWFAFARLSQPTVPFQNYALEELTDSGKVGSAVISPDGRYVVFTQTERGETSLHIRQVVAGSTLQIQPATKQRYAGLAFSLDGNYLFFTRREPGTVVSTLFRISSLGGDPVKILDGVYSAPSFSPSSYPDGQRMAYLGFDISRGETRLMSTRLDGSDPRTLKTVKTPLSIGTDPVWSPDGKSIAIGINTPGAQGYRTVPVLVPAAVPSNGGAERTLSPGRWSAILNLAWTPDSKAILLIGATPGITTSTQIWHLPASGAEPTAITNDVNTYTSLSSTADGKALLAVKRAILCGLYVMDLKDSAGVQQIVSTGPYYTGTQGLAWSPDGKFVYTAKSGSGIDLWIREAIEPATPKRLTSDNAFTRNPRLTADGKQIFFTSNRTAGIFHVWMLDTPSATLRQITTGDGEELGAVTPDGQTVFHVSANGNFGIFKTSVNGGGPTQITARHTGPPSVSPDGRQLAFLFVDDSAGRRARMAIMPAAGGEFVKTFDYGAPSSASPSWTPDGTALTYTASVNGTAQIWLQPVDGTPPRQVTKFASDSIYSWAWSNDGKRLALSRGNTISDAVLIRQKK